MPDKVSLLHRLAGITLDSPAGRESLVRVLDLVRDAVGAEQAAVVYAEDSDSLVCSDSGSKNVLDTNQMGIWLIGHQMEIAGGPVAFNIRDGRVCDIVPARDASNKEYLSFSVAGGEGSGEMLIIQIQPSQSLPGPDVFAFVEAATPAVTLMLDHVLGLARASRQKEQMMALANAAELLIQAEDMRPVLEDLATAISRTTGFDLVTIDVYDNATQEFAISVINRAPQVATSLGRIWEKMQATGIIYPEILLQAAIKQREPIVIPDLQTNENIPEVGREFFKRAHIFTAGQFPITFHDQFLGVLRVGSQRPRSFPQREVDVLSDFAAQLAVALEAADMYRCLAESERQLKEYAEELQASMEVQHRLARTDPLTGIPNRRYVDEITRGECSRAARHKTPLALVLVDIDFFKGVNDTYGHKAGDEALLQLGDLARRKCRRGDVVGRYGGDEFLFILPNANLKAALKFADRFRTNVAGHVFAVSPEANIRMTVSAGVAEFDPTDSQKPSSLIRRADEALFSAKTQGRNRTSSAASARRAA